MMHQFTIDSAAAQLDELAALEQEWYAHAITCTAPKLRARLRRAVAHGRRPADIKKRMTLTIDLGAMYPNDYPGVVLAVAMPPDYPGRMPDVACDTNPGIATRVEDYLAPFTSNPVALGMMMEFLSGERATLMAECLLHDEGGGGAGESKANDPSMARCFVLKYNHLLKGPEHKKEKEMVDAAKKSKLQGAILWGTPGIVLVVPPSNEEDARDYASTCRTIGKRADLTESFLPLEGLDRAGVGGLHQQKRGGKLVELDMAGLRLACGGEELLKEVLGLA